MKRLFFILALFVISGWVALAQQWIEVVYLKDGSVIRGTIIEQVPDVSLKIQTSDGSVFVYTMDRVERITKEEVSPQLPGHYRPQATLPTIANISTEKEPYAGRSAEGKFLLDIAGGVAPINLKEVSDMVLAEYELSPYVRHASSAGLALHLGFIFEHYFKAGSPWLYDIALYGERLSFGFNWVGTGEFYPGKRIASISYSVWDVSLTAGVGFQFAPNTEGMHFYFKAGAGASYVMIAGANGKVFNPETGAIHSSVERSGEELSAGAGVKDNIYLRPYAEIGIGGDSYFRLGVRYSPILFHSPNHCVTLCASIPLF